MGLRAVCTEAMVSTELDGEAILRLLVLALGDEAKLVRVAAAGVVAQLSRWGFLELGEREAMEFVASFV